MITAAFSTPKRWTLLSWLIRKFTKSKVSHCLIGIHVHGIPMFLECTAGGVKISLRSKYEKTDNILYEYKFLHDMSAPLEHAYKHLQESYDYAGLVGFAWVIILWRLFKRRVRNPFASSRAMWCSEFMLHLNHNHVIPEWKDLDPELTHCQHLLDRIELGARTGSSSFEVLKRP